MITKSQDVPLYLSRLHIAIIEDYKKDFPLFNKKFNQDFTEQDDVLGGCYQRKAHTLIIINVDKHKRSYKDDFEVEVISTITHEAVHACNFIFNLKGIRLDSNNDEPQAYLTDWITREVYKTYLKTKK